MKWTPNATSGTIIAGAAGNASNQFNRPYGLFLDEAHAYLYFATRPNHRIQRYNLYGTLNVTTVAS